MPRIPAAAIVLFAAAGSVSAWAQQAAVPATVVVTGHSDAYAATPQQLTDTALMGPWASKA